MGCNWSDIIITSASSKTLPVSPHDNLILKLWGWKPNDLSEEPQKGSNKLWGLGGQTRARLSIKKSPKGHIQRLETN